MPLRAEGDAGSRGPAQNAADTFHSLLGLRAQSAGDSAISCRDCHIHDCLRFPIVNSAPKAGAVVDSI
jgi:hypothetical protein